MKIIVTGAAGFIGSHLCVSLIEQGHRVIGIDNLSRGEEASIHALAHHPDFEFHSEDAGNWELLNLLQADLVIHLASQKIPRYSSGWETLQENARVSNAILDYCIRKNVRLLFASTSDVYGKNPTIPYIESSDCLIGPSHIKRWAYATSKLHTEQLMFAAGREFGLRFQIMRFFGCYGPRQAKGWWGGPHSVFMERALLGEELEIHGDGKQTRCFIYIHDLIRGILALVDKSELENGIFNFCSSEEDEIAIVDLAKMVWNSIRNDEPQIRFIPYAQFGDYEDVMRRVGSSAKAEKLLNWKASISLEEGLKRTIDWQSGKGYV
jgi:UDP-glucose 4-epimerase